VDDIVTYDTLYSFLYLSFSFRGFSYKVFDEQCLYKVICHITKFSPSGFLEDDIRAYWPYGQGVIRLRLWAYLKGSNNIGDCISRGFSLFFHWVLRSFSWYSNSTLDFSHWVFFKDSHIFAKRFLWDIVILSTFPTGVFKDNTYDILIFDQVVFRLSL
jgi:hypothetical protein